MIIVINPKKVKMMENQHRRTTSDILKLTSASSPLCFLIIFIYELMVSDQWLV
jgi:hypothetical protein